MMETSWNRGLRALIAAGLVVIVSQGHAADQTIIMCPTSITPSRPDTTAPAGWEAYWSGQSAERLRGIEVVHGGDRPPLAFLVPTVRNERRRVVGSWDLRSYADDPEPIWLYCQYENTALRLTRPLPHSVQTCMFIATDNGDGSAGFPMTAECR